MVTFTQKMWRGKGLSMTFGDASCCATWDSCLDGPCRFHFMVVEVLAPRGNRTSPKSTKEI